MTCINPCFTFIICSFCAGLIIQSEDSTKREQSLENIYNLLQDYFKESPSSADIFYSIFYRKCRNEGLFGEIVSAYKEIIRSNFPMSHIPGFLQYLMIRPVGKMNKQIVKLWKHSLDELEPLTKDLFLHNFKLDLERRMCAKIGSFREYEKMRFRVASFYDIVALEGYCSSCNCYTPLGCDLIDYLEKIHLERRKPIIASCPACKKGKSMIIPFLL
jgi:hypothetical protein